MCEFWNYKILMLMSKCVTNNIMKYMFIYNTASFFRVFCEC